ncbi:MAG: flagellum-specific ATP synthase FliI, partial [Lachnospiraceae bacterium]|nr:flagellum-specific ATP synthase FliI [Lachnospiraceae bacterium]
IADKEHKKMAGKMKEVMATYAEAEDLIHIGAYKSGSSKEIDYAIEKMEEVNGFLLQETEEKIAFEEILARMEQIFPEEA